MAWIAGAATQTDENTAPLAARTVTCLKSFVIAQEAMSFLHIERYDYFAIEAEVLKRVGSCL